MAYPAHVWIKDNEGNEIVGGCTQAGREGSIEALAFEHELQLPKDPVSSKAQGVRRHKPVKFLKEFDQASPLLYKACCEGQLLQEVRIDWYTGDASGKDVVYFTHVLNNCRVTQVRARMHNTHDPQTKDLGHEEEVEIVYSKISWRHEGEKVEHIDDWEAPA